MDCKRHDSVHAEGKSHLSTTCLSRGLTSFSLRRTTVLATNLHMATKALSKSLTVDLEE